MPRRLTDEQAIAAYAGRWRKVPLRKLAKRIGVTSQAMSERARRLGLPLRKQRRRPVPTTPWPSAYPLWSRPEGSWSEARREAERLLTEMTKR